MMVGVCAIVHIVEFSAFKGCDVDIFHAEVVFVHRTGYVIILLLVVRKGDMDWEMRESVA